MTGSSGSSSFGGAISFAGRRWSRTDHVSIVVFRQQAFVRDHPGCMLGSVVGALAADMTLVRCCPSYGVFPVAGGQSGARHHRNRVSGGPRRPEVRQATDGGPAPQAPFGARPSERMLCPNLLRKMEPTFRPTARKSPRTGISSAMKPCRTALRAFRTARTFCAETDLQWTGRPPG